MKVIIPVINKNDARNKLAGGFHNAQYLCIYDWHHHSYEWLSIDELTEKPGNLTLALKKRGIYTVISPQMPLMALGLFVESGFRVYRAIGTDLEENIQYFLENQLKPFEVFDAMSISACSLECSSCHSVSCN